MVEINFRPQPTDVRIACTDSQMLLSASLNLMSLLTPNPITMVNTAGLVKP